MSSFDETVSPMAMPRPRAPTADAPVVGRCGRTGVCRVDAVRRCAACGAETAGGGR